MRIEIDYGSGNLFEGHCKFVDRKWKVGGCRGCRPFQFCYMDGTICRSCFYSEMDMCLDIVDGSYINHQVFLPISDLAVGILVI